MIPGRRNYSQFPDRDRENALWLAGYGHVGGVDEAGRGAWAGPVFAAVVILSQMEGEGRLLGHVRDSKQMTAIQRMRWAGVIKEVSQDWGIGSASNEEIDRMGILPATHLAVERALGHLHQSPDYLLLDYLVLAFVKVPQEAWIKGDQKILSIAAASVLAKTARDEYMDRMGEHYPQYSFSSNKGYGTQAHRNALELNGICPIHRISFKPVNDVKSRQISGG